DELSRSFFEDLEIPEPVANLGVGSGSHARQTGEMMRRLDVFLNESGFRPDWVVVYGDTNSTLAAAIVAVKRGVPVAHVEAGLRSYDNRMPEELNRVMTDRVSTLLFCPTQVSVDNLAREGIERGVCLTGDVMFDSVQRHGERALGKYAHPLQGRPFTLATVHRAENTDDRERLRAALACLGVSGIPVLWPVHPRARSRVTDFGLSIPVNVTAVPPIGYLEMLAYLQYADRVITDSGGVQKEAYWLGTPCVTLRSTTEWPETLEGGWNVLTDVDMERFKKSIAGLPKMDRNVPEKGGAALRMVSLLKE
ncbi:MAG TPA: UDP-N-acetylglucosamine 2-epimerase (non-hydrolyzing), partial [Rhodothermia bacterium]|nr:UDP-N-acetylglucosamine 2-epimerase (non-hydrolyzing) [Rhodothermia bacterium]